MKFKKSALSVLKQARISMNDLYQKLSIPAVGIVLTDGIFP